jgi:hypothetical protein
MGGKPRNAPTGAYIARVDLEGREIYHRMVSEQVISKFRSGCKSASDKGQMATDLISPRNKIEAIRRWPQLTKW